MAEINEQPQENIIILGAGASADAEIPLLANFVDTMWELAIRGNYKGNELSDEDLQILKKAMAIREELDHYHGRAMFNDRNLEDILSLLSFNEMPGIRKNKEKLQSFIQAISRTIEISCLIKHSIGCDLETPKYTIYEEFWRKLTGWVRSQRKLPTLITFNYDLVLERSITRGMQSDKGRDVFGKYQGFYIRYYCERLRNITFQLSTRDTNPWVCDETALPGGALFSELNKNILGIELIKLHGSLNFPKTRTKEQCCPVCAVENPLILPPIFNKIGYGRALDHAWCVALQRLRKVKNIIIVGYSLPDTDIYMQYFLKAGLGPNKDLNKITVFDPLLFQDDDASNKMKERYKSCFSPQLQSRIDFNPECSNEVRSQKAAGTFKHLVEVIAGRPGVLF